MTRERARSATGQAVLSKRALSRATLARQGLLEGSSRPVIDSITHLVGLQAQVPRDPYVALWSRLIDFAPAELEGLLTSRAVVRTPLLRGTVHLVTARDGQALRPLVQPVLTRGQKGAFGRLLAGVDLDALAEAGRALLNARPHTFRELREALGSEWAGYDSTAVTYSISYLVPLVQVPPRGLWTSSGQPTWSTTEAWLGRAKKKDRATLKELVLRYLAAFGPASVADVQAWCGLPRLSEVVEPLRKDLVTFVDEAGVDLFDLPYAPRPDGDTPAPVRFLPQYDNVFLGHADRSRVVPEEVPPVWAATATSGWVSPVLVDGFIRGLWRLIRAPGKTGTATLRIQELDSLAPWTSVDRDAVSEEGTRLLEFLAPTAAARTVELTSTVFDATS